MSWRDPELGLRIISAAVMVLVALGVTLLGGISFMLLWAVVALLVISEWFAITEAPFLPRIIGGIMLALCGSLVWLGDFVGALGVLGGAAIVNMLIAGRDKALWVGAGCLYAGALLIAPVVLRSDAGMGIIATLWLFAVVWMTDICAYVCGRMVGGPKLWPAVSPGKTWSGAVGGTVGGALSGVGVVALWFWSQPSMMLWVITVVISIAAQGGDLLESAIKRQFGVKDAGHIIPGHGGMMDRVDGFVVAVVVAVLIGIAHQGLHHAGQGLLIWS